MRLANLFVVLATSTALLLEPSYSAQSRTAIEGIVLEGETDQPLEGVTVSAVSSERSHQARTDSAGHFTIEIAAAGRYRVVPAREGMVYAHPARLQAPREPGVWVELSAGQVHDVQLRMVREAVITGRVVDANNNTLPERGSNVSVLRYIYDERGTRRLTRAPIAVDLSPDYGRIDDRGEYRLYGLQPGDYYISARAGVVAQFYPGTADEVSAVPVRVRAGEELRLGTIVLPGPEKQIPVRFRMTGSNGESLGDRAASGSFSLSFRGGAVTRLFTSFSPFGGAPPEEPAIRSLPLAPGEHDLLISLAGGGTNAELFYSYATLVVGDAEREHEVRMTRGIRVTGSLTLEDAAGSHPNPEGVICRLYAADRYTQTLGRSLHCLGAEFSPALYRLDMSGMPPDAYVESAQAGGEDILAKGLQLSGDTELKIVIRSPGSVIEGTVTGSRGDSLSDAVVALVPDAPLRSAGVLYRSVVSDVNGGYQLRGIAPGSYQLFAWTELEGAAYRNAEFMKDFDGKGTPVRVQTAGRTSIDLTAF